ncbi:hypothetical protein ACNKHP_10600 [Shigella boydii]
MGYSGIRNIPSIGIAIGLPNMPGMQGLVINPGSPFYFTAVVSLVTGTMFLMWLGEQITERGISNGISIIIFAGIVADSRHHWPYHEQAVEAICTSSCCCWLRC